MLIQNRLIDADTYEGIPSATVAVVDNNSYTGPSTVTDYTGSFILDNYALDPSGTASVLISSVGYEPVMVDPVVFTRSPVYALDKRYTALEPVTVTPKKTDLSVLWLLLGGFVVYQVVK